MTGLLFRKACVVLVIAWFVAIVPPNHAWAGIYYFNFDIQNQTGIDANDFEINMESAPKLRVDGVYMTTAPTSPSAAFTKALFGTGDADRQAGVNWYGGTIPNDAWT